ncbi:DNA primase [Variibacter gotjawalensis]|uniref:DNA primase n=1 Tax=Variibacter gotjawalensis TaxID=1333996 RepID=A0A0S3PRB2_9BRAD|nr:DNA primase [Variibacter gotjawalensis]NIK48793.1 DNA primase [Variibacter gotjawalensis]RZS50654.1 DNA primase [Variibacter gotjawalensis]BAT58487.1 DNA primase [Variibacter gotjawalensis]
MRFPPQFLDDIRARLPVSEVVAKRVQLKKQGREWRGLSPFNKEKTPSFYVNDQKGFYHDFSSGKHGDIFGFVMDTEGLTFPEAVERLAGIAGLPMPVMTREAVEQAEKRKTLHDVMELAAKFFQDQLAGRAGAHARGYLADRSLDAPTQQKFRIGYAPNERFALKEALGAQGIPVGDMIETGLLIAGDDIPVPYDRFRDRVMFPITDIRGRVIAFGGRALQKDVPAKYLNSPETTLFHKGATLYNIAAARQAAHQGEPIVVAEGYVDVIALVGAGFRASVAPLGTAMTEDQLALMWKMADEPIICLDGDSAGRKAAYRAVDLAMPKLLAGKSLRFASLPAGQDPDDLVRSGGAEALREVIRNAMPLAEMLWVRETEHGGFDTPERRAALEARLGAIINTIADQTVRKYYRDDLSTRVRSLFGSAPPRGMGGGQFNRQQDWRTSLRRQQQSLNFRGGKQNGRPGGFGEPAPTAPSPLLTRSRVVTRAALPPREALLLVTALNHPWLLEHHAEELADLEFRHADGDRLRHALLDAVAGHTHAPVEPEILRQAVIESGLGDILTRIEKGLTHTSDWPARPGAGNDDVIQWWNHVIALHHKDRTLHKELNEAERTYGNMPTEENWRWLQDVLERRAALEGSEATIEDFGASSGRRPQGNL